MKITVKQSAINAAFAVLGTAKIAKFDFKDQKAVFAVNNILRPLAEEYNTEAEEVRKRLQPEGWNEVQPLGDKVASRVATKEETAAYMTVASPYFNAVNAHLADLGNEMHDVDIEPLPESLVFKMLDASDWDVSAVNALAFLTKPE